MAEPDRTNADAERVSDIVPVAWRWKHNFADGAAWHLGLTEPVSHPQFTIEPLYTADIIEAQSKALAEASKQLALTGTDALSSGSAPREDAGLVASRGFADALIEISLIKIDLSEATDPIALFNHLNRAVKIAQAALTPTSENPNG